jgi:transposase
LERQESALSKTTGITALKTTRKHNPSFCHQTSEVFEVQCNKEHTIMKLEAIREVKGSQRLKYRRTSQRLQTIDLQYEKHAENNQITVSEYVDINLPCSYIYI